MVFLLLLFFVTFGLVKLPAQAPEPVGDTSSVALREFNNGIFSVMLPEKYFSGIVIRDSLNFTLNLTGKDFLTFFNGGPVEFHLTVKAYDSKSLKEGTEKIIAEYNKVPDEFFYNPEKFKNNPPKEIPEFWLKEYFQPVIGKKTCQKNDTKYVIITSRNYEKPARLYHTRFDFACFSKALNKTVMLSFVIKHCDKTFTAEKAMNTEQYLQTVSTTFCPVN